jgi:hypothetical protein
MQTKQKFAPRTKRLTLRLNFENTSIEVPFDNELRDFFAQVEPNTAKSEDIHVLFSYFQMYWPFKTYIKDKKPINYPQLYRSYFVREDR